MKIFVISGLILVTVLTLLMVVSCIGDELLKEDKEYYELLEEDKEDYDEE